MHLLQWILQYTIPKISRTGVYRLQITQFLLARASPLQQKFRASNWSLIFVIVVAGIMRISRHHHFLLFLYSSHHRSRCCCRHRHQHFWSWAPNTPYFLDRSILYMSSLVWSGSVRSGPVRFSPVQSSLVFDTQQVLNVSKADSYAALLPSWFNW